jgi:aspartate beta-hydroxylase
VLNALHGVRSCRHMPPAGHSDDIMATNQLNQLLASAHAAQQSGRSRDAERLYGEALAIAPNNPGALNSLGIMALGVGDFGKAVAFHARAAAADPAAGPLWLNLARAQREIGDDDGERASLTRALAIDRLDFMALVRMAQLHERLGELAEALPLWSGIVQIMPPPAQRNDGLNAIFAHAQEFVARQSSSHAQTVTVALAADRADHDAAALRRFDACVAGALGQRRIYTNVCAGLHVPFLPADEFFEAHHFPWFARVEAQTDAIRSELMALIAADAPGFGPYVLQDPGTPQNLWTGLDNNLAWTAFYLWKYGERIEDACARCPVTAAMLEAIPGATIPGRAPTAFFSILKPHTRIPPHTGVTNSRAIIHLPLIVPEGCGFRVGGETRSWNVGEAFAFDDTIEHEAWNDSNEMRAVLIFDVWNPHLTAVEQTMIQRFFAASDASKHAPCALAAR